MQLAGELSKISIPNIVQLVRNGGLTGEISLSQGSNTARILVEKGRVVHVESSNGAGKEAFLELFLWLTGTFSFIEGPVLEPARNFPSDEPIDRVLREGVTYLEQKRYLDQLRIGGHTVFKPTALGKQAGVVPLLNKLDGQKTLAEALVDTNLSRRAYINAVHHLMSEGLVVVAEPDMKAATGQVDLPGWVVARLKQDNSDLVQAIVDMVVWVDRVKCWMYQADADLERIIDEVGGDLQDDARGSGAETLREAAPAVTKETVLDHAVNQTHGAESAVQPVDQANSTNQAAVLGNQDSSAQDYVPRTGQRPPGVEF